MTEEELEQLRDKDHVVLKHIEEGLDDVQKITAATTLENHHVSYSFQKLEQLGLITIEKPDKMIERIVDGQKRVFQHPKKAELTDKGLKLLEKEDIESNRFEDLTQRELTEKVNQLENKVEDMEQQFELFRRQVKQQLRHHSTEN